MTGGEGRPAEGALPPLDDRLFADWVAGFAADKDEKTSLRLFDRLFPAMRVGDVDAATLGRFEAAMRSLGRYKETTVEHYSQHLRRACRRAFPPESFERMGIQDGRSLRAPEPSKPYPNVRETLLEAMPDAEEHWGPSNAFGPESCGHASRKLVSIVCDSCGREFQAKPVKLARKTHPWTCPECIAREVGSTAVPVRCVDDGIEFESIGAAARWLASAVGEEPGGNLARAVGFAARNGGRCRGRRFELFDAPSNQ